MPKTYYDSDLTGDKVGDALEAIDGVIGPQNNGKILYVTGGKIRAKSASEFVGGAVESVNGMTGNVVLTAEDVGALPGSTSIPTKTSDLTNDSGFITSSDLAPYRTAADQDVIDDAMGDKVDALKSAKAPVIINTASGATASFDDGAGDMPLKQVLVNIEPVQAGSGDPSPENVRPISGWTGCNVTRTGKNLLPNANDSRTISGITFTVDKDSDGNAVSITTSGTATDNATYFFCGTDYSNRFVNSLKGTYILSGCPSGGSNSTYRAAVYGYINSSDSSNTYTFSDTGSGATQTVDCTAYIGVIIVRSGVNMDGKVFKPMLRLSSDTDPTFEPYHGNTYPITFPSEAGTVYGGTMNVTNGVLTVDRRLEIIDGNKILRASTTSHGYNFVELKSEYFTNIQEIVATNVYPVINTVAAYGIRLTPEKDHIYVYDNRFVDLQTAQDIADTTNIQVLYALTTPVTYQLTPQEVTTLLGINNVCADCGPVSVEYPADTKLYIQKINTPTDDDMTADTQIASGKYFLIGNTLYLSTTTIPVGDTIIPGTNCTKTNLAEALNALNT